MLAPVMLALLSQEPEAKGPEREKLDQVQLIRGQSSWDLDWADAEDRMHGTIRPIDPVAEKPLELSVMVGTFQGPEFDGPVTMTLRCPTQTETLTVRRAKGERAWFVRFVPVAGGECGIDIGFMTTRHKLLHLKLLVLDAPLSRLPWFVILGVLSLSALGLGIRAVFRRPEQA